MREGGREGNPRKFSLRGGISSPSPLVEAVGNRPRRMLRLLQLMTEAGWGQWLLARIEEKLRHPSCPRCLPNPEWMARPVLVAFALQIPEAGIFWSSCDFPTVPYPQLGHFNFLIPTKGSTVTQGTQFTLAFTLRHGASIILDCLCLLTPGEDAPVQICSQKHFSGDGQGVAAPRACRQHHSVQDLGLHGMLPLIPQHQRQHLTGYNPQANLPLCLFP